VTTALRICECEKPSYKPQKPEVCVRCGFPMNPAWVSSDATHEAFWRRLEDALYPNGAPDSFLALKLQSQNRERAGRHIFGFEYLKKDNLAEATEEISDAEIYIALDSLQTIRERGSDQDMDMVLTAMAKGVEFYEALLRLRHKRRGAT
jgi:hypothetical protein